jgi:hypothetical protein
MTPKEKAEELADKYFPVVGDIDRMKCNSPRIYMGFVVQCALIAVDEIYNSGLNLRYGAYLDEFEDKQNYYSYWEDVKKEINQLITTKNK